MKIPVWYRDKNGRYHRIPPGLLETFADGRVGFSFSRYIETPGARDFLTVVLADPGAWRYVVNTDQMVLVRS